MQQNLSLSCLTFSNNISCDINNKSIPFLIVLIFSSTKCRMIKFWFYEIKIFSVLKLYKWVNFEWGLTLNLCVAYVLNLVYTVQWLKIISRQFHIWVDPVTVKPALMFFIPINFILVASTINYLHNNKYRFYSITLTVHQCSTLMMANN